MNYKIFSSKYWLEYLKDGLHVDLRATCVGSLVGIAVSSITLALANPEPIEHFITLGKAGEAQPFLPMILNVIEAEPNTEFKFVPGEVKETWVCEGGFIAGTSYRDIILKYVDRHSTCFDIHQIDKLTYEIRPNYSSQDMRRDSTAWTCKCAR